MDEKSETEFEQGQTARAGARSGCAGANPAQRRHPGARPAPAQLKTLHACIKKVTEDLDGLRFNTAISALMVFVNDAMPGKPSPPGLARLPDSAPAFRPAPGRGTAGQALRTRSPQLQRCLAYHRGRNSTRTLLVEDTMEMPVQVNGKLATGFVVPAGPHRPRSKPAARRRKGQPFLAGKPVKKVIVVPKKLVNVVVG